MLPLLLSEIPLVFGALLLLLFGVFRKKRVFELTSWLAVGLLFAVIVMLVAGEHAGAIVFNGAFVIDEFAVFMKLLVLIGSLAAILMSMDYMRDLRLEKFEFPILILFATAGMMMMISANDMIAVYIGIELQSLSLYVMAAFRRDAIKSTEAGLKYFVLGALSSGMLLYGMSLIYGFTGSTNFTKIAFALDAMHEQGVQVGLIFGLVFMLAGLAFKISAVPFHMWTPDVYEGAPTPVTAFFASAPKIAAIALLTRVVFAAFPSSSEQWQQIMAFLAITSVLLGAFAAIGQTNIKRLMAYSSIGHVGFVLIGLAAATPEGVRGMMLYMVIYLAMTIGVFAVILSMRRSEGMVEDIGQLAGLSRTSPVMAFLLAMLMFSLAGIPPLAGFFAKWFVFVAAIKEGLYVLAVIGVLASVVGAFYYIRIIKIMYFDEPAEQFISMSGVQKLMLGLSGAFVILFWMSPIVGGIAETAEVASKSLF
jgi:NADH-quinone oxidoreductase subunit N